MESNPVAEKGVEDSMKPAKAPQANRLAPLLLRDPRLPSRMATTLRTLIGTTDSPFMAASYAP
jgi:hypothetical protein